MNDSQINDDFFDFDRQDDTNVDQNQKNHHVLSQTTSGKNSISSNWERMNTTTHVKDGHTIDAYYKQYRFQNLITSLCSILVESVMFLSMIVHWVLTKVSHWHTFYYKYKNKNALSPTKKLHSQLLDSKNPMKLANFWRIFHLLVGQTGIITVSLFYALFVIIFRYIITQCTFFLTQYIYGSTIINLVVLWLLDIQLIFFGIFIFMIWIHYAKLLFFDNNNLKKYYVTTCTIYDSIWFHFHFVMNYKTILQNIDDNKIDSNLDNVFGIYAQDKQFDSWLERFGLTWSQDYDAPTSTSESTLEVFWKNLLFLIYAFRVNTFEYEHFICRWTLYWFAACLTLEYRIVDLLRRITQFQDLHTQHHIIFNIIISEIIHNEFMNSINSTVSWLSNCSDVFEIWLHPYVINFLLHIIRITLALLKPFDRAFIYAKKSKYTQHIMKMLFYDQFIEYNNYNLLSNFDITRFNNYISPMMLLENINLEMLRSCTLSSPAIKKSLHSSTTAIENHETPNHQNASARMSSRCISLTWRFTIKHFWNTHLSSSSPNIVKKLE